MIRTYGPAAQLPEDAVMRNGVADDAAECLACGSLHLTSRNVIEMARALEPARGMLQALRSDYDSGHLQSVVELVHAGIFADFLDMAYYLLQQGCKDPAAVVTGSVLEAHLRKLCDKHGIPVVKPDGSPRKADTLNSELAGADVYSCC